MASILKVDELQGITAAGDITVTSEGGAATQSLQQGLAKCWFNLNGGGTPAFRDSINMSSVTDNSTGDYQPNINNNMTNANYVPSANADGSGFTVAAFTSNTDLRTTSALRIFACDNNATKVDWSALLYVIHGDLA